MGETRVPVDHQGRLKQYIEAEVDTLLRALRHYVIRAGLTNGQDPNRVAVEVLNEVTVEALKHAERFTTGSPMPWLMGIAMNILKRRQAAAARLNRLEPLMDDLYPAEDDDAWLDQWLDATSSEAFKQIEHDEDISSLFHHLSDMDAQVLRLALLCEFDGDMLGEALHVTPGTARVRLHRALKRIPALLGKRMETHE